MTMIFEDMNIYRILILYQWPNGSTQL